MDTYVLKAEKMPQTLLADGNGYCFTLWCFRFSDGSTEGWGGSASALWQASPWCGSFCGSIIQRALSAEGRVTKEKSEKGHPWGRFFLETNRHLEGLGTMESSGFAMVMFSIALGSDFCVG